MKPEIDAYLREHGDRYTSEALRSQLIEAGHDPDDVDAALRERQSERTGGGSSDEDRRRFRRWTIELYVGTLVAVFLLVIFFNGIEATGLALLGAAVLGLLLVIGWAVTSMIGRALLPRTGMTVALVVPVIAALGLGGTCLAIMDGMIPTPPTPGLVELHIEPPLSFEGSGTADCFIQPNATAFSMYAYDLGTLDGRFVSVSIDSYSLGRDPNAPAPAPGAEGTLNLRIGLNSNSESVRPAGYGNTVDTSLQVEASANGLSGTVTFDGLASEPMEEPGAPPRDPISGSVTWTCEDPT